MAEPTRIRSAGVQCLGGEQRTLDFTVPGYNQHLDPHAGEVLILPFEVAKFLIQTRPTKWQALVVVPSVVPTGVDGPTGLDTLDVVTSTVWGITKDGQLYWDDAGVDGADVATVTYSSAGGLATFDGGYGQSIAHPKVQRRTYLRDVHWQQSGYERVDATVALARDGTGRHWIDVPKSQLHSLDKVVSRLGKTMSLTASLHPGLQLSWRSHEGGTMIEIAGGRMTRHPDPHASVVVTYWRSRDDPESDS